MTEKKTPARAATRGAGVSEVGEIMHQTSEEGNSNALISAPVTRTSIGAKTGLSGKELTQHIKNLVREGGVVAFLRHTDPATTQRRERVYSFVARQQNLAGAE